MNSRRLRNASRIICCGTAFLLLVGCSHTVKFATTHPPGSVSAHLARPTGPGPFPAVILLHGGTGIEPNHLQWSSWLANQGYVSVVIDSLRSGDAPTVDIMVGDATGALNHLRTLPFVHRDRIAIMGFSRGGAAALAAVTRLRDAPPSSRSFRAGVIFYPPGCSYRIERAEVPVLLLLGQLDGGSESCSDMARRLEAKDPPSLAAVIYPNAYHAFDDSRATSLVMAQAAAGVIAVRYDPQATADAQARVRKFLAEHLSDGR
jgi:dienelactone hydrolase